MNVGCDLYFLATLNVHILESLFDNPEFESEILSLLTKTGIARDKA